MKRHVLFISDQTGITAEALGNSLLTQFETITFVPTTYPFVDTPEKAQKVVEDISVLREASGENVLIFATIVNPEIQAIIETSEGILIDFFKSFIERLETELDQKSTHRVGRSHGIQDKKSYTQRIDAVNFVMNCDDGLGMRHYGDAELILLGVSRSGKTPTSLYLGLQYGIYVANYPLTEDDCREGKLPDFLQAHRDKLFGLTIKPSRLHSIRSLRKPDSQYASLKQCRYEVQEVESLLERENIPQLNTTKRSIEEIASKILAAMDLKRHY